MSWSFALKNGVTLEVTTSPASPCHCASVVSLAASILSRSAVARRLP